jgi:hypothetical protein
LARVILTPLETDAERDEALRSVALQDHLFENVMKVQTTQPQLPSETENDTGNEIETTTSSALRLGPYGELIKYIQQVCQAETIEPRLLTLPWAD